MGPRRLWGLYIAICSVPFRCSAWLSAERPPSLSDLPQESDTWFQSWEGHFPALTV